MFPFNIPFTRDEGRFLASPLKRDLTGVDFGDLKCTETSEISSTPWGVEPVSKCLIPSTRFRSDTGRKHVGFCFLRKYKNFLTFLLPIRDVWYRPGVSDAINERPGNVFLKWLGVDPVTKSLKVQVFLVNPVNNLDV